MVRYFHFDCLSSTQDKAFELAENSNELPLVVSAKTQTDGRGRLGRSWHSEAGRSLVFSLAIKFKVERLPGLSLLVALSISKIFSHRSLQIKWPNDLMLGDEKVGGILVEARSLGSDALVVIGVGLNLLNQQFAQFVGLNESTSLEDIIESLTKDLEVFSQFGFSVFHASFEDRMWRKNEAHILKIGNSEHKVLVTGVSEQGLLKTDSHGEFKLIESGEIVLKSPSSL